jgi:hypothetical protein
MFWDEKRVEKLEAKLNQFEEKMDKGFAATRSEIIAARSDARGDFRLLLGVLLSMFMAMILGFTGMIVAILLQHA